MSKNTDGLDWKTVIAELRSQPLGAVARIPINQIEHPLDARMLPTVATPVGQRADYRIILGTDLVCHVQSLGDVYQAQLHQRTPVTSIASVSPNHLQTAGGNPAIDAPAATILGATALGALLGAALGGSKNSAMAGALLGGCAGLAAVSVSNAEASPATANMSKELFRTVLSTARPQAGPSRIRASTIRVRASRVPHTKTSLDE